MCEESELSELSLLLHTRVPVEMCEKSELSELSLLLHDRGPVEMCEESELSELSEPSLLLQDRGGTAPWGCLLVFLRRLGARNHEKRSRELDSYSGQAQVARLSCQRAIREYAWAYPGLHAMNVSLQSALWTKEWRVPSVR
jgi:hypothetical protein